MLCRVGPKKAPYRVHADLLCRSSAYFRRILQPNRRKADECSICQEKIRPRVEELTHCSAHCGVNFHFECLEEWKRTSPSPVKCPLCRREWKEVSLTRQNLPYTTQHDFEIYIEWLYRKRILTEYDEDGDELDDRYEALVDAYGIGERFEDKGFCNAVLHAIIEACADTGTYPPLYIVRMVYDNTNEPCDLRNLLVEIYIKVVGSGMEMEDTFETSCIDFLRDLSRALFKKIPVDDGDWSLADLKSFQTLRPMDDTEEDEDISSSGQDGGQLQWEEEDVEIEGV